MGISATELERVQFSMAVTAWPGVPSSVSQPADTSVRSIEDLALDGMLAARFVRQAHPEWYRVIPATDKDHHDAEASSIPELLDAELEEFPE